MTREEIIINEVQECIKAYKKRPMYRIDGVDCIVLDNDDINHISHKCAFWILSKEQDTLKEFVEWQAKQYKDLYYRYEEEIKEEKDHDDFIWLVGKKAGIGEIRQSLKTAVEKFLEERK